MPTLVVSAPGAPPLRVAVTAADALVRAALPALLREAGATVEAGDAGDPADVALWTDGAGDDTAVPALALVAGDGAAEAAWRAGARGGPNGNAPPDESGGSDGALAHRGEAPRGGSHEPSEHHSGTRSSREPLGGFALEPSRAISAPGF